MELNILPEINKLTNLQLELLKTFNRQIAEDDINNIRILLANYFANKARNEMDELWQAAKIDETTLDNWLIQ